MSFTFKESHLIGYIELADSDVNVVEMLWIKISIGKSHILLGGISLPPQSSIPKFLKNLKSTLSTSVPVHENIFILGHLNANYFLNIVVNNSFNSHGVQQSLEEPTRITLNSSSHLDPVVNKPGLRNTIGTYTTEKISDDLAVYNIFTTILIYFTTTYSISTGP